MIKSNLYSLVCAGLDLLMSLWPAGNIDCLATFDFLHCCCTALLLLFGCQQQRQTFAIFFYILHPNLLAYLLLLLLLLLLYAFTKRCFKECCARLLACWLHFFILYLLEFMFFCYFFTFVNIF